MDFYVETEVRNILSIPDFKLLAEAEKGVKIKTLRTDKRGEFNSIEFDRFYVHHGIKRHLTAPYSPQQNGVVERRIVRYCPW